ncbi:hypothetical protein [Calidithermus timidus]|jgi:hypothetical protein|uniref:hypothetical protein n=1 Tax=Calidithermus timidus TaxID=307124 RepID=UPI00036343D4|nr:hypothetical protein [Calidithermus timidus]
MQGRLYSWVSIPLLSGLLSFNLLPSGFWRFEGGSAGQQALFGVRLEANLLAGWYELRGSGYATFGSGVWGGVRELYMLIPHDEIRLYLGKRAVYATPLERTPWGEEGRWGIYGQYRLGEGMGLEAAYVEGQGYVGGRVGGLEAGSWLSPAGLTPRVGVSGELGELYYQWNTGWWGRLRWALDGASGLEAWGWWNPQAPEGKLLLGLGYDRERQVRLGADISLRPIEAWRLWLEFTAP